MSNYRIIWCSPILKLPPLRSVGLRQISLIRDFNFSHSNCRIVELFGAHQFFNYLPSVSGSSTNLSNLGFLSLLKKRYPEAEICFILNSELKGPVNESMREVCKHYNVKLVELHDIEKQNGHPSISGMKSICAQLLEAGL